MSAGISTKRAGIVEGVENVGDQGLQGAALDRTYKGVLLLGLFFFGCLVPKLSATTIVAIWTPTGAIIGADAKVIFADRKPAGRTCKIGVANNNIVWAQSGVSTAPEIGIEFHSILANELTLRGSIDTKLPRIERVVSAALKRILNAPLIKAAVIANPDTFRIQIIISSQESGMNRMFERNFMPGGVTDGKIEVNITQHVCPGSPDCHAKQIVVIGTHQEVDRAVRSESRVWGEQPVMLIKRLIAIEIGARPNDVGPPVGIVGIDKDGVRWIEKGACGDR